MESKRELILEHAKATFAEKGFEGTRIIDIAKRADIGKGTVYEYFKSKSEILMETCEGICQNNLRELEEGLEFLRKSSEDPSKLLHFTIVTMVEKICFDTAHLRLFMDLWKDVQDDSEAFKNFKERLVAPYQVFESFLEDIIKEGMEKNVFPKVDPRQITFLISSGIDGLVWQYSFRKDLGPYGKPQALADAILSTLQSSGVSK